MIFPQLWHCFWPGRGPEPTTRPGRFRFLFVEGVGTKGVGKVVISGDSDMIIRQSSGSAIHTIQAAAKARVNNRHVQQGARDGSKVPATAEGWQDQPVHGHKGVKIRLKFKMSELKRVAEQSVGIHVPFHHKFSGLSKL